ncbi:glycine--tRNA ligase subunit beta [Candidatus Pelagibacter sp.]|nr:glycine--tRNA ligase subunit beta [Candidatus Pelagibacter sp.]
MSEFFLEVFTEEIPAKLQSSARNNLLKLFRDFFSSESIETHGKEKAYSTPNRLIIHFDKIKKDIIKKAEEIRGPKTEAPDIAIEGFIKSNNIKKKDIFKKKTDKGEFYFFKKPKIKLKTHDILEKNIPNILNSISWNKSMKWGQYQLYWGRPLKSILAVLDGKTLKFKYHHLNSSNTTYIDKNLEEKTKLFKSFSEYQSYFKKLKIIIDNNLREKFIYEELKKISLRKNLKIEIDKNLLKEVTDLVEKPKILFCSFDKKFLLIPEEIIILTMKYHQKYFSILDNNGKLTNNFFVVSDNEDSHGYIKSGNESVIEARLSDAEFFWRKNKSQNMVKQVSGLKKINFFKGLGSYFEKVQRIRKLSGIISDELLISKEKIEIASSICKVDLLSDLVGEFPELQGILGGYYANAQGFEKDVCLAISEHYLPIGIDSKIPKKPYSVALSLSDKLDSLVGFFGKNLKPSSSKDPYALRRSATGIIRIIIENNMKFKLRDLINYSANLYNQQELKIEDGNLQHEIGEFLVDRLRNYMKEKEIRTDIIESAIGNNGIDNILDTYKKALNFNKVIKKQIGEDVVFIYKRASNIISEPIKKKELEQISNADPGLFKNEMEKNLYKKIHEIRKFFTNVANENEYQNMLIELASSKKEVTDFFDNVTVNDENDAIRINRLGLLQMLCATFNNYFNFSKIDNG